ncbi:MAG: LysM peptidoglycan-binding domain-containing protein [Lachnospiraceae bacterium]|nr:LysM peptidoglycan-binding domain-containing protein [Lachnospiraceae bacterium]
MGEVYNPYPKLPKNIRQIGERDQILKLYVEDYVNTYLKRLYPAGGQDLRVGLLLGESRNQDGETILFVDGAMEMDGVPDKDKVEFTESAWKEAYQAMEQMFPRRSIIGWFLCGAPSSTLSPLNYWKPHSHYFNGKNQLMYLNCGLEGEEAIYTASEDGFYKLRGYYIYYERNQMMQDYMVSRKDAHRVESGTRDAIIQNFRTKMDDNRVAARQRRSMVGVLSTACGVLTILVLASGVVMMNNYNKMRDMESVIVSALPEGSAQEWSSYLTTGAKKIGLMPDRNSGREQEEVEYEEIPGEVYPTRSQIVIETEGYAGMGQNAGNSGTGIPGAAGTGEWSGEGAGTAAGNSAGAMAAGAGAGSGTIAGGGNPGAGVSGNGAAAGGSSQGSGSGGGGNGAAAGDSSQESGSGGSGAAAGGSSQGSGSGGGGNGAAAGGSSQGSGSGGGGNGAAAGGSSQESGSGGAGNTPAGATGQAVQPVQIPADAVRYVVQDGETLYGICMERYHNIRRLPEICQWNQLDDENRLFVGQELYLPPVE